MHCAFLKPENEEIARKGCVRLDIAQLGWRAVDSTDCDRAELQVLPVSTMAIRKS